MLESTFKELLNSYQVDNEVIEKFWKEILTHYGETHRYYHNLTHLEDLLEQLNNVKKSIENWDILLFTLFYHDIIYNSLKKDNEEQSARIALARLREMGISENDQKSCYQQIIATKAHQKALDRDINFFIDADLSILGRSKSSYEQYCQKIRKEYSMYPSFLYKRGRRKVVKHFLSMDRLFKTDYFFTKFEEQARSNLSNELQILNG